MDTGKFIGLLVFFLVGALVLVAFVPVIQETTSATDTFTNAGYYSMDELGQDAELTISWDKSTPMILTVGETAVDMTDLPKSRSYTIIGSSDFVVRYDKINDTSVVIQGYNNDNDYFNVGDGTEVTITVSSGSVTCHSNRTDISGGLTTEYTFTDVAYALNPLGNGTYSYIMKDAAQTAYVKGDSVIYFLGVTNVTPTEVIGVYASGTLDDGMTVETAAIRNVTTVDSYTDPVPTYTEVNGYKDLYALEKYEFTINYDSTESYDVTYSYFIVPYEVTAEKEYHADTTLATVINLLPLIAGIGLLMFLIGEFLYTRYL